jgi:hypothetical protein
MQSLGKIRVVLPPREQCDSMKIRPNLSRAAALRACLPGFIAVSLSTRALAATCPESEWSFVTDAGWQTTGAAVFDTSAGMTGPMGGERVSIDVPGGRLGVYRCCGLGITATVLVDAFDVVGVPPGTNVTAVAELGMDGWILGAGCGASGCWGDLRGTVSSGTHTVQQLLTAHIYPVDSVHVSATVVLPVTIMAGTPVQIDFTLEAFRDAGGNNGAHGIGSIVFSSLPAGVRVTSCKGYGLGTTPERATSWGTLKLRYR